MQEQTSSQEFTLVLQAEEVNALLQVLGELPTKVGAWPLVMKIKTQAESQANSQAKDE